MPAYNSHEWQAAKGEISIEISRRHFIDIQVSCTKTVQVHGLRKTKGHASVVLRSGTEFILKGPVKGFDQIIVKGTGQTPFGLRVRHLALQDGEYNSGERPPVVALPEPSNLVQKMRQMAADHHRFQRMPVLEPGEGGYFSRYEVDDDEDEVLFEEEAFEKHKAEKAAAAKKKAEEDEAKKKAAQTTPPSTEKPLGEEKPAESPQVAPQQAQPNEGAPPT